MMQSHTTWSAELESGTPLMTDQGGETAIPHARDDSVNGNVNDMNASMRTVRMRNGH
jgi:hypothetical protein